MNETQRKLPDTGETQLGETQSAPDVATAETVSGPAAGAVATDALPGLGDGPRYLEGALLGRGGMGDVRLCLDAHVGREIAMKAVRAEFEARADLRARFLHEARVQGQLEHPSIVPVYDLADGPEGAFFTMKRVRGETLEDVLERLKAGDAEAAQRHSQRKLLAAFGSVCLALDFAHRRGVVHRDVKPSNIMLGDFGEVYLLDWGLAKLAGASDEPVRPALGISGSAPHGSGASGPGVETVVGAVMGTPGYMAPEQIRPGGAPLDGRADVYALGAILFEIAALEPLHAARTNDELIASTLGPVDARPSLRRPDREIAPEIDAICTRATRVEPDDRFASARELHEALERFLDGDRDLELRARMAKVHEDRAAALADEALGGAGSEELRKRAMQELSRALALDPMNAAALRTMVRLMTEPPKELPAEVAEELEELERQQTRVGGKTGAAAFLSMLLYLPILVWMGVRSAPPLAAFAAFAVGSAVVSWNFSRQARPFRWASQVVHVASTLATALLAGIAGPFVLVPAVAAASTLIFSVSNPRARRPLVLGIGCLAVLLPWLGELLGLLPASYAFDGDRMAVLPRLVALPALQATVFLVVSSLAIIVTAALSVGPFRDDLDRAQRQMRLQAWQLRHLLPSGTGA